MSYMELSLTGINADELVSIYSLFWFRALGIVEAVSPVAQQHWDLCTPGRNEPCTLPLIVELVAGCMGRSAAQIAAATTQNAIQFFNLNGKPELNIDASYKTF